MKNPIAERPWLLVVFAFLVIIAVWITVIRLSGNIETRRLTPAEEAAILIPGGQGK